MKHILWLSLPDDQRVIAVLEKGDTFTTDVEQAMRLASAGYTVKRRDTHSATGEVIETELSADVLASAVFNQKEMRGDPTLNMPADLDSCDTEHRLIECRAALLDIATTSSSTRIRKLAGRTLINTTPKP
jgi:hypothetical protein